jgi:hypothetical protein
VVVVGGGGGGGGAVVVVGAGAGAAGAAVADVPVFPVEPVDPVEEATASVVEVAVPLLLLPPAALAITTMRTRLRAVQNHHRLRSGFLSGAGGAGVDGVEYAPVMKSASVHERLVPR